MAKNENSIKDALSNKRFGKQDSNLTTEVGAFLMLPDHRNEAKNTV